MHTGIEYRPTSFPTVYSTLTYQNKPLDYIGEYAYFLLRNLPIYLVVHPPTNLPTSSTTTTLVRISLQHCVSCAQPEPQCFKTRVAAMSHETIYCALKMYGYHTIYICLSTVSGGKVQLDGESCLCMCISFPPPLPVRLLIFLKEK